MKGMDFLNENKFLRYYVQIEDVYLRGQIMRNCKHILIRA